HFPGGFPQSALVHDGWKPQINTEAKHHQSCLAHLQRTLKYLNQCYADNQWGIDFISLLYDALELKRNMTSEDYKTEFAPRNKVIERFEKLLKIPPKADYKELNTFYRRMCREKEFIFTFLKIEEVPPDNNASERAVRNIKVKQKISGQFKTESAAQNFAKIRS
ncbi:transposase, partial [uncultured Microscilla sp.]|uniref:IS66 family transposase n=1 Tax=uncultured Microscilla sp. TaxID=432653 RepID=UPI00261AE317